MLVVTLGGGGCATPGAYDDGIIPGAAYEEFAHQKSAEAATARWINDDNVDGPRGPSGYQVPPPPLLRGDSRKEEITEGTAATESLENELDALTQTFDKVMQTPPYVLTAQHLPNFSLIFCAASGAMCAASGATYSVFGARVGAPRLK